MRKILSTIVLASAAFLPIGCGSSQTQDAEKNDAETGAIIQTEEGLEMVELSKVPLPCTKEKIYAAWKQIGRIEGKKGKMLDYRQTPLTLFISTDLDGDETPEILLRGEAPYAAIFTYAKDSLQLITFVDHPRLGLGVTPDGYIMRSGSNRDVDEYNRRGRRTSVTDTATGKADTVVVTRKSAKQSSLYDLGYDDGYQRYSGYLYLDGCWNHGIYQPASGCRDHQYGG